MKSKIKIIPIAKFEKDVLLIDDSVIEKDSIRPLLCFNYDAFGVADNNLDCEIFLNSRLIELFEKWGYPTFRYYHFPNLKNATNKNELLNYFSYFSDHFCPANIFIDSEVGQHELVWGIPDLQRYWLYEGNLLWASRRCTSKDDYHYIKLKVEEFILERNEEYLKLKNKVERLNQLVILKTTKRTQIPNDVLAFVLKRDREQCVECGALSDLQFDHLLPVSRGGNNEPDNLRILCKSCNLSRGNLTKI